MVLACFLSVPLLLGSLALPALATNVELLRMLGPQGVNLWKLKQQQQHAGSVLQNQDASTDYSYEAGDRYAEEFPEQWFDQPLDHFDTTGNYTFRQRYWVRAGALAFFHSN